jgi:hypothetical protein
MNLPSYSVMLLAEAIWYLIPTHNAANYVPAYPHYSTCSGNPVEMTMNYMDYTDDRVFMFSKNQEWELFCSGGARASSEIIFFITYIEKLATC